MIENYKIELNYENNIIEFNIENIRDGSCYRKVITQEAFHKMRMSQSTNITDMKCALEFYKRVFERRNGYVLTIYQTPIYREGERTHNELIMKCATTYDGFYEVYSHYQMEERALTFEEKMTRMIEKMKSVYEEKIEILEKEIDELRYSVRQRNNSMDLLKKYDEEFSPNVNSVNSLGGNEVNPHKSTILLSSEEDEEFIKRRDQKGEQKFQLNEPSVPFEEDQTFFYPKSIVAKSGITFPTAMSRKEFIYKYEKIFSQSPYSAALMEFMNDETEEVIYHRRFTLTNQGKLFFIVDGVKVQNYARVTVCELLMKELHAFDGAEKTLYEMNGFFEELRKRYK